MHLERLMMNAAPNPTQPYSYLIFILILSYHILILSYSYLILSYSYIILILSYFFMCYQNGAVELPLFNRSIENKFWRRPAERFPADVPYAEAAGDSMYPCFMVPLGSALTIVKVLKSFLFAKCCCNSSPMMAELSGWLDTYK